MKTTKSLAKKAMVVVTGASLMVLTFAGTVPAAGGSIQDTEAVWGKPVIVQKLDNGAEKRFYKYQNTMDVGGYRSFTYKDGRVIGESIENAIPAAQAMSNKGVPTSELSRSYYKNHPMTTQDVDQTWGKAVAVRTLDNGTEERYYKLQNTMDIGYRVFQFKDGKVVANGITALPAMPEKKELKGVPMGFMNEAGSETIAEVEGVWGQPVGVKKLANGMEERYYKYGNTINIGNRLFLFKDGKAVGTAVSNF